MIDVARFVPRGAAGRVLRAPLRLLPAHTAVRVLQGPLAGARWVVGSSKHSCWLGCYEADKQRAIAQATRPGMTAFDLGANAGFYTLLFARLVGAAGEVHAFEPLPGNLRYLREHLRLNGVVNVHVHAAAVAAGCGTRGFSFGNGPAQGRLVDGGGDIHVATVSLDHLVFSMHGRPPDVVKIDIEGGEHAALEGMSGVLERYHPVLFIAFHEDDQRRLCLPLLQEHGYHVNNIQGLSFGADECEAMATAAAE